MDKGEENAIPKMSRRKTIVGYGMAAFAVLLVFAVPLLPVKIDRLVDLEPFNQLTGSHSLVFFGYPGCGSACPATLPILAEVYERHGKKQSLKQAAGQEQSKGEDTLNIVFIDLIQGMPSHLAEKFAKGFHPDFQVLRLNKEQMKAAGLQFGLKFSEPDEQGLLFHKGYTYLLNRVEGSWRIKFVYVDGVPTPERVLADLDTLERG